MWKKIVAALLCVLMISVSVAANSENGSLEERIQALEERVEELERLIAGLESGNSLQPPEEDIHNMQVGESVQMTNQLKVKVESSYFADSFQYYTSSYGRARSLQAQQGYDILCVEVNFENLGLDDIDTETLLKAEAVWNDGTKEAYSQFFCEISEGYFYKGIYTVGGKTSVTGALLFAIPEESVQNNGSLKVLFNYGDETYACVLREDTSVRAPSTGDSVSF